MVRTISIALVAFAVLRSAVAHAVEASPYPTTNQSVLAQLYGLPTLGSARTLAPGRYEIGATFDIANQQLVENRGIEELLLDGESRRLTLSWRYATTAGEWGIDIPYVSFDSGSLDDFIERWHDTFGLPQGNRKSMPSNQFAYAYRRNGVDRLRVTQPSGGLGDIRLRAAWPMSDAEALSDLALRTSVKLPTGEASSLHGSGAADAALWISAACGRANCRGDATWNAAAGVLALGKGDVLSARQRDLVWFGEVGTAMEIWPALTLKAELHAHTAFYRDTALEALGSGSVQLIFGGVWRVHPDAALEFGITEDIKVDSAPDVGFVIAYRFIND
jgi:hypothetical protein